VTSSLLYEALQCGDKVSDVRFTWWAITQSRNVEYSMYIVGSSNIFGCVGIKKQKYCILNKQYSKDEYEKLRATIIEQMDKIPYKDKQGNTYTYGEFFPIALSPFSYNETSAQEFFPLQKEEAQRKGYQWKEMAAKTVQVTKKTDELPDTIDGVLDSITKDVIECLHKGECNEQCTKGFTIIPAELKFYQSMNLPLSRLCPNCRHAARTQFRNPLKLWERQCQCAGKTSENSIYENTVEHFHKNDHCSNNFQTAYSPDKPDIIYCEQCYLAEVT